MLHQWIDWLINQQGSHSRLHRDQDQDPKNICVALSCSPVCRYVSTYSRSNLYVHLPWYSYCFFCHIAHKQWSHQLFWLSTRSAKKNQILFFMLCYWAQIYIYMFLICPPVLYSWLLSVYSSSEHFCIWVARKNLSISWRNGCCMSQCFSKILLDLSRHAQDVQ